jgi:hypothetical protein
LILWMVNNRVVMPKSSRVTRKSKPAQKARKPKACKSKPAKKSKARKPKARKPKACKPKACKSKPAKKSKARKSKARKSKARKCKGPYNLRCKSKPTYYGGENVLDDISSWWKRVTSSSSSSSSSSSPNTPEGSIRKSFAEMNRIFGKTVYPNEFINKMIKDGEGDLKGAAKMWKDKVDAVRANPQVEVHAAKNSVAEYEYRKDAGDLIETFNNMTKGKFVDKINRETVESIPTSALQIVVPVVKRIVNKPMLMNLGGPTMLMTALGAAGVLT